MQLADAKDSEWNGGEQGEIPIGDDIRIFGNVEWNGNGKGDVIGTKATGTIAKSCQ